MERKKSTQLEIPQGIPRTSGWISFRTYTSKINSIHLAFNKCTSKQWNDCKGVLLINIPSMCANVPLVILGGCDYCNYAAFAQNILETCLWNLTWKIYYIQVNVFSGSKSLHFEDKFDFLNLLIFWIVLRHLGWIPPLLSQKQKVMRK